MGYKACTKIHCFQMHMVYIQTRNEEAVRATTKISSQCHMLTKATVKQIKVSSQIEVVLKTICLPVLV